MGDGLKNKLRDIPILDVVNAFYPGIDLKRDGSGFKALCPFHQEKTGSFHVNTGRNIFHCFGCGKGGDTISFVQEIERCDFPGALRKMCEQFNIPYEASPREMQQMKSRKDIYRLYKEAAELYHSQLFWPAAKKALEYLVEERKISVDSIKAWKIGVAFGDYDLCHHFRDVDSALLVEAGLIRQSTIRPGDYYDFFRNRIMFPITSAQGQVIAFAGRAVEKDNDVKYINSPESRIYVKSKTMFGMDKAIRAIRTSKQAIVVEGYTDAVMAHQHSIENCLGIGGTAFTPEHIRWLSNMVDEIVLCFDADRAGAREAERVGKECLSQGIPIRLVDIGKGDPDEYMIQEGRDAFLELVKNAHSLVDFTINARGLIAIEDPDKQYAAVKELHEIIDNVASPLQKRLWLKRIADVLDVSLESLVKDYRHHLQFKKRQKQLQGSSDLNVEQYLLGFLAANPAYRKKANALFVEEDFSKPTYGLFFRFLCTGKDVDDVIKNPDLQSEKDNLFAEAHNTKLIDAFRQYCSERNAVVSDEQACEIEGIVLASHNNNPNALKLMEKHVLAKELKELEYIIIDAQKKGRLEPKLVNVYTRKFAQYNSSS